MPSTASPVALPVASVRRHRHAAFGTLLALVLALAWLLPAAPAAAACDGVTVRVERSSGSVVERCVTGATPGTGLQALERAGFRYTFVPGQPGMVCTIDGHPDPCNDAPDDAYWAYWHADAGASSWTYSSRGGGNRGPSAGGHEAWVFGGGMQRPPSSPPPAPAPAPTPTPSPTSPPAAGGGTGSSGGSGSNGGSGSGSSGGVSASGSGSSGGSSSSGSGAGSTSGSGSTSGPGPSTGTAGGEGASSDRSADEGRPADPDAQADASSSGPGDGTSTSSDEDAPTDGGEDATAADASDRPRAHDAELATGDEVVGDRDADTRTEDDAEVGAEPAEPDVVAIGTPGGGRSLVGVAVGGTLAVGLAGAAVVRSRRRGSDLGHEL